MQRVRKVVDGGDLIVLQIVDGQINPGRGGSNAMYLLEYHEFGEKEYDAALGRAIREHAEDIIHGEPEPTPEPEPVEGDIGENTQAEVIANG